MTSSEEYIELDRLAVKNFASLGKTPPFIKIDSTAKGKALISTLIFSTSLFIFTKGKSVYRRNVPAQGEAYEVGGLSRNWIENQFGTEQAPSYYELDLRLK